MEQTHILSDIEQEINYEYATTGQRFANFIIDSIVVGFVLGFLIVLIMGVDSQGSYTGSKILDTLFNWAILVLYYTIIEGLTKGRSLGKMVTRTRVIKEDGTELTFNDALLRSLSRIVPFEPFSTFSGHPWHDKWTKTRVVKM